MGSCLSPFLTDIFMNYIEDNLILTNRNREIHFWCRYLDDCLAILDTAPIFCLRRCHNITLKVQKNNKLNFLDFTISNLNNKFEFGIFSHFRLIIYPRILTIILNIR